MRILSRTVPYIMAATLAAGVTANSLRAETDRFDKSENKTEKLEPAANDFDKKGIPWLDIMGAAGILTFLGILKIADLIDKKERQEESQKAEKDINNRTQTK